MADQERPPVVLFEDEPPAHHAPPGWRARDGFDLPATPWDLADRRWLCVGAIGDEREAGRAIEALSRGVGLAVVLRVTGDLRHRTLEDLHHLGIVTRGSAAGGVAGRLDAEDLGLLRLLAGGRTVAAAAEAVHISRRTANRRLAQVRARLGVETNAEAISLLVAEERPGR